MKQHHVSLYSESHHTKYLFGSISCSNTHCQVCSIINTVCQDLLSSKVLWLKPFKWFYGCLLAPGPDYVGWDFWWIIRSFLLLKFFCTFIFGYLGSRYLRRITEKSSSRKNLPQFRARVMFWHAFCHWGALFVKKAMIGMYGVSG